MTKKKIQRLFIYTIWSIFFLGIFSITTIFFLISNDKLGFMPSFEELENPKSNLASEIYSSDNKLLGKYYIQNRSFCLKKDISNNVIDALIATEDIRFYEHSGIDIKALFRVAYGVFIGKSKGGGSTITQQLAKNLFKRDTTRYNTKISRTVNMVIIKFKEWVTSVKLERNYTKDEILTMYLNTVDFGSHAFGIKAAARTFFNTTTDSLKIEEASVLIGLLKAPTFYSPLDPRHKEDFLRIKRQKRSKRRRNVVMKQMLKYGFLEKKQYDSLSKMNIKLNYNLQTHNKGLSTYFREYLRITLNAKEPKKENYPSYLTQKFKEDSVEWKNNPIFGWCKKNKKSDGNFYNLYKDGIKIYTTIDSRMQKYAEEAMELHLSKDLQKEFFKEQKGRKKAPFSWHLSEDDIKRILKLEMRRSERYRVHKKNNMSKSKIWKQFNIPTKMKVFSWDGEIDTIMTPMDSIRYYKYFLHSGVMSMDVETGHVKAYVGGINYKHFKFDNVKVSKRQVGSTFKPFLYTLAMQEGLSPCYKVPNISVTFQMPEGQNDWTPANSSDAKEGKMVTLKWGLANSINNISAWLMKRYTPDAVIKIARKMGIISPIDRVPAICLGTPEISLYEMVGAYGSFVNNGIYTKPIFITKIEDKNGNVIGNNMKAKKTEAINKETAYSMLQLLQGVTNSGTSIRLRRRSDSIRYNLQNPIAGKTGTTQNQSDGWFMGLTPELITGVWVGGEVRSIHFRGIRLGQGANMALPIFGIYMNKVYKDSTLGYSKNIDFEKPDGIDMNFDCNEYEKQKVNKEKNDNGNFDDNQFND